MIIVLCPCIEATDFKFNHHHHSSGHSLTTGMAQRGVWQLKKLLVAYCDISGSSAGARYELRLMAGRQLGCYLSTSANAAERS